MPSRIKGITIEIGANTVKLTEALRNVDSNLKDTQADLRDVNKLLKLDPGNVQLLAQKQELLQKATAETAEKIRIEKEALAQLKASPDAEKTIDQQKRLEREIISNEASLKKLESGLEDTNKDLKQFGDTAGGTKISLESMAKATDDLTNKTAALSAASAAGLAALAGSAVQAGKTADDLNTLSKQTGFTTAELQNMKYASDLIEVSMEDMTGSIQKLVKQMASGSDAFTTLGVSVTDETGQLRNATEVWYETLEALSQVENETQRDALAMEIFGKSAASLAGIVDDGGEALKNYGKDAEDLGLIMSQDTLDAANKLNDAIDLTKARLEATFLETGAKVAETVLPIVEEMAEEIAGLFEWISTLDEGTIKLIGSFLIFGTVLSPILKIVSGGISLFNGVTTALGTLSGTAIPGVAAAAGTASGEIIASMAAILPWVAAPVAAVVSLIAVFQQLKKEKAEAQEVQAKQDLQNQGYKYVSAEDLQYYQGGPAKSLWNGSGWDYYVEKDAKYDWSAKQEAQNNVTYNMTNNISRVDDLQDLLDMADQAQQYSRMGGVN
jgi:phage-related minor tail protein